VKAKALHQKKEAAKKQRQERKQQIHEYWDNPTNQKRATIIFCVLLLVFFAVMAIAKPLKEHIMYV
jgi:hypothetical protein